MRGMAPRIYCIPATAAPMVAVFRRGPTRWCHMGRWDLSQLRYESGAWLHGRIFPRRCDLSPDGRLLSYFAHKPGARWEQGEAFVALSKLPWLTALFAFATCGTWTRGYYFSQDRAGTELEGAAKLPIPYGLRSIPAVQFATERRRGWDETPDCTPRDPADIWDQHSNARLHKAQPRGSYWLCVESLGRAGGEFGVDQAVDGMRVRYWLESDGNRQLLEDLQWADWDREGNLLAATRDARLQIRQLDTHQILFEKDLSRLQPNPTPAPGWAGHW